MNFARFKRLSWLGIFATVLALAVTCSKPSGSEGTAQANVSTNSPCITTASTATPKQYSIDQVKLGINLTAVADWSSELPFLDSFKTARFWLTQCRSGEPGCTNEWDSSEQDQLDLDDQGWVKSLPAPEDAPQYTRVGTLIFREMEGKYPGGQYVVLYDGEGKISYGFDAQKDDAASKPGRDVINVTPSDGGIWLKITETDPNKTGNYIRNIHVVPIQYEQTFEREIFNPVFLDRLQKFPALRFMDWMHTNNSEQQTWDDRPHVTDAIYSTDKGVPLEIMIALANRLGANPWFNIPHQANDEYITQFAQTVKTCLKPPLKAYVEFSNEVWNWQFQQAHYALEQGKARWGQDKGDAFMQWYGMRTAQMADIWKRVFADDPDRVVTVMGTQTAWKGLETSALDCSLWAAEGNAPCYQHNIDIYAVTGYFSGSLNNDEFSSTIESWLGEQDGGIAKGIRQLGQGDVIEASEKNDSLAKIAEGFQYHLKVAQERGLRLVAYEGGQHLVSPNNEKLTDFFIRLNRSPEMYGLYSQLLEAWKNSGGTLFMHYAAIGRPSKWGSWGALETVDQTHSPKYDALIDFVDRT